MKHSPLLDGNKFAQITAEQLINWGKAFAEKKHPSLKEYEDFAIEIGDSKRRVMVNNIKYAIICVFSIRDAKHPLAWNLFI